VRALQLQRFPSVVCCETCATDEQKEEHEDVSAYADAATYKFILFASLVVTGHSSVEASWRRMGRLRPR